MRLLVTILLHAAPDAEGVISRVRIHDVPAEALTSDQALFDAVSMALMDDVRECKGGVIISHCVTKL